MKITKKILQDIIKEELTSVLQEQDPQKQKEKTNPFLFRFKKKKPKAHSS